MRLHQGVHSLKALSVMNRQSWLVISELNYIPKGFSFFGLRDAYHVLLLDATEEDVDRHLKKVPS